MFYKILYIIVAFMVCTITVFVSISMTISDSVINNWKQGIKDGNHEVFLKWYTKYEKEKLQFSVKNDLCTIDAYNVYIQGSEEGEDGYSNPTEANGYLFIIHDIDPNKVKYNNSASYENDSAAIVYMGDKKIDVTFSSYEFYRIGAAQVEFLLNDTSTEKSVLESFSEQSVNDISNFDKIEFVDPSGQVIATMENVPAVQNTNYESWEPGYTASEKEQFNHPSNLYMVFISTGIVLALFVAGFFLLFYRKKKNRLFLSDKPNDNKQTTTKQNEEIKASSVSAEKYDDIIDEDKIVDDDVDENALL